MNKRLLYLLLVLVMGMFLISCGGDDSSGTDSDPVEGSSAESGEEVMVGDPVVGKTHYDSVCIACHGPDATGLPNLGKDLTTSEFIRGLSDSEFVNFVKTGRSVADLANTTGVDMPPKGGNPALSDQDLYDIVSYVRTLQK